MYMLIILGLLIVAVLANVMGTPGAGVLGARQPTWILTLVLFAVMLAAAGKAVCARWDGIFIDRDNRISLARFQLILWTGLIVSAFFTAGLTNIFSRGVEALAISVPKEIWALLGIGAFSAVAAPAIKESQKTVAFRAPPPARKGAASGTTGTAGTAAIISDIKAAEELNVEGHYVNRVYVNETPAEARWINLVKGDYEGADHVDVSKLQQLVFTVVLVTVYGFSLWVTMKGVPTLKGIHGFPVPHESFIALLGISHATYLADKQLGNT